jgi:hypothetical protein
MKQKKPVGITIFAVIGILLGILFLLFSILLIIPKIKIFFLGILGIPACSFYILTFVFLLIGICFLSSSIGLLKGKLWSRRFFLLAVLSNMIIEVRWFAAGIEHNQITDGGSPVVIGDVLELAIALALPLIAFWYFDRENVRNYFNSEGSKNDQDS